ncbi:adenylate/guanylate cyclase domain-containing protein [Mycobacterium sp. EPa45]|uniref:adenylate/guanylate cyclase domain-containing protein n=1 Tax=Mycobacterium sp. EPa45 TaxID=1545728 RepID=UPI0006426D33|nr:adenylate/guanylate cyclase domain-containing protein [Mycobacterium sp. EPa45]AKK30402.1 cyclase [Mycobacterium sp. EPa45]
MGASGDGRDDQAAAGLSCHSCGTELSLNSNFCSACGAPVTTVSRSAEYKQVTVLFADVVRSMHIAAVVDIERLREIMTELVELSAAVTRRYGGTVDFTGDGIMAVFGAPISFEDHATRACRAALDIHRAIADLAQDVSLRDGVDLQLRVGLNSGQVIAGEIGSAATGYTAVGEQVGMAQRMESVASAGGVMLSASTARLVQDYARLGEPELVTIKGSDRPVTAYRLLGLPDGVRPAARIESALVGRRVELTYSSAVLDRAMEGRGAIVAVVGSPGIGKSRLAREVSALAAARGVEVVTAYCESHTADIPFHAVARLLRAAFGITGLDNPSARARLRHQAVDADPDDMVLLEDLLGITDSAAVLPKIDPDARRRRLTTLVNATWLTRGSPTVYIIEDAHWMDEVSESMLADFLSVTTQAPALVLITYRPEYDGALRRLPGAQGLTLAPLTESETGELVAGLLGLDPSVADVTALITKKAAGNPFFAEEMVRDLAERGILGGYRGAYAATVGTAEVTLPATVQATIAARIDRLAPTAKRALHAAAVVGAKFDRDMLAALGVDPAVDSLVGGQFVDQIDAPSPAYVFHHPLIRTVAYESQLKSDRAELHRKLAAAIQERDPVAADENAALTAEHLEAAGDLVAAFEWHMRSGAWSSNRDIGAARASWTRALSVADRLPDVESSRITRQIAARTLLCSSAWRAGGTIAEAGFDQLRELCGVAGDERSLAIGMAGYLMKRAFHGEFIESSRLASEFAAILESIGDPSMTVGLLFACIVAKWETGEMIEATRLADRALQLADGDPTMGNIIVGSPLAVTRAMRGIAKSALGQPGWREDFDVAIEIARGLDPLSRVLTSLFRGISMAYGALLPDEEMLNDSAVVLRVAEQSGDDFTLANARLARAFMLMLLDDEQQRTQGLEYLAVIREAALAHRFTVSALWFHDISLASEKARSGQLDEAIALADEAVDAVLCSGEKLWPGLATTVLVEALLLRGTDEDVMRAEAAIDRLEGVPTDPGFVLHELPILRLRALLACARDDVEAYREYRDRYRAMATDLGFEGHIKFAATMT